MNGIVSRQSRYPFDETVARLIREIEAKGATLFAVIDHAGEARRVGLDMPPTKLVIFGNPVAGTPLMLDTPDLALDLPLKILVREGSNGAVSMAYETVGSLADRHALQAAKLAALAAADKLTSALGASAAG